MNTDMCLIPLTLRSGTIKGVEQWDSYKALRKAMRSGRVSDIRAVGEAIVKDMSDPKKAKAYNDGMRLAEQGARAAEIMLRDNGEIGKLMDEAQKTQAEMKEYKALMEACNTKKRIAGDAHLKAVNVYIAKPSTELAKQMNKTAQDFGKHRMAAEKYQRGYEKKKAETDKLYEQAMTMATGRAKREMIQEAEKTRTKRKKYTEEKVTETEKTSPTEEEWEEINMEVEKENETEQKAEKTKETELMETTME